MNWKLDIYVQEMVNREAAFKDDALPYKTQISYIAWPFVILELNFFIPV